MKVLFIGSRLYDDVAYHVDKLGIESIITESNEEAPNLDLPTKYYIVPRGMDNQMKRLPIWICQQNIISFQEEWISLWK